MNNQPKIEAFNSFYAQGKELYTNGDINGAREAFIKACELANDISINSSSFEVRNIYYKNAVKILAFIKNECVVKPKKIENGSSDVVNEFKPLEKSLITFKDVAGLDDVKEQIRLKVLEPLKNPKLASMYKITPGAKRLLYGPPGTGKTFIARAIAGEVDAAFYAVNCQDLISKYMGDSSKRLDDLFNEAEKNDRAIIFFDEFDSVASKRSDTSDGVDQEMSRFVATFLTKVDGFKKNKNKMLLLIAATNRPWAIDSAMLRGGRFDTHIYVSIPDQDAREFLVSKALDGVVLEDDLNISEIAKRLKGYGGGDITAICEKIRLNAYSRSLSMGDYQKINNEDCNIAISSSHNMISEEDILKFEAFKENGRI